jgi:D-sedoheptulose 7-phosphate isomerase
MSTNSSWPSYLDQLATLLRQASIKDAKGAELGIDAGFAHLADMALRVKAARGCLHFAGNGASASMASHFAADIAKNARIRTATYTDPALITAVGNDISYESVYSEPLRWQMHENDLLVAISSSGNSPNIVAAAKVARELGACVLTFTAMSPDNALRSLGHGNFYLAAQSYGLAESGHSTALHYMTDLLVEAAGITS